MTRVSPAQSNLRAAVTMNCTSAGRASTSFNIGWSRIKHWARGGAVALCIAVSGQAAHAGFFACETLDPDAQTQAEFCATHISCRIAVELMQTCADVRAFLQRFTSASKNSGSNGREPTMQEQVDAMPTATREAEYKRCLGSNIDSVCRERYTTTEMRRQREQQIRDADVRAAEEEQRRRKDVARQARLALVVEDDSIVRRLQEGCRSLSHGCHLAVADFLTLERKASSFNANAEYLRFESPISLRSAPIAKPHSDAFDRNHSRLAEILSSSEAATTGTARPVGAPPPPDAARSRDDVPTAAVRRTPGSKGREVFESAIEQADNPALRRHLEREEKLASASDDRILRSSGSGQTFTSALRLANAIASVDPRGDTTAQLLEVGRAAGLDVDGNGGATGGDSAFSVGSMEGGSSSVESCQRAANDNPALAQAIQRIPPNETVLKLRASIAGLDHVIRSFLPCANDPRGRQMLTQFRQQREQALQNCRAMSSSDQCLISPF